MLENREKKHIQHIEQKIKKTFQVPKESCLCNFKLMAKEISQFL